MCGCLELTRLPVDPLLLSTNSIDLTPCTFTCHLQALPDAPLSKLEVVQLVQTIAVPPQLSFKKFCDVTKVAASLRTSTSITAAAATTTSSSSSSYTYSRSPPPPSSSSSPLSSSMNGSNIHTMATADVLPTTHASVDTSEPPRRSRYKNARKTFSKELHGNTDDQSGDSVGSSSSCSSRPPLSPPSPSSKRQHMPQRKVVAEMTPPPRPSLIKQASSGIYGGVVALEKFMLG